MKVSVLDVQKITNPDATVDKLCTIRIEYLDAGENTETTRQVLLRQADLITAAAKKQALRRLLADLLIREGIEPAPAPDSLVGDSVVIDS